MLRACVRYNAEASAEIHDTDDLVKDIRIVLISIVLFFMFLNLWVDIRFGTRVDDLLVENGNAVGVEVSDSRSNLKFNSQKLGCDAAVLAVRHSGRDIYQMLLSHDTILVPKEFALRFLANICIICFHWDIYVLIIIAYFSFSNDLRDITDKNQFSCQNSHGAETYECTSSKGLYPIGEGAGYAVGIVSAAVDGMYAGFALAKSLDLYRCSVESVSGKAKSSGFTSY
ncbi:hypothetical protein RHMOL_Rhmol01G0023300 [Rhododendron molle]|uniref:Uncharacterized protein n=1 Tax=Rhododendron molle TaxID=49168 RepID=A0ACC0PZ38_RHOML|nr:hypothetical protein RHMOL_Rhmol01G0023300 [Rhododendron molle]